MCTSSQFPWTVYLERMDQLPDDVLVVVMQYLEVKDVLACRLVCKRLTDVALHRDLWRHRTVSDNEPWANAVLNLAPCLQKLQVTGVDNVDSTLALTTTRCAVASLVLETNHFNDLESALVVRNQETLGRLKHVVVGDSHVNYVRGGADVFLRTLATCSGLESLEFKGRLPRISRPFTSALPIPSLTRFSSPDDNEGFISKAMPFVSTILTGHAKTLEDIDLYNLQCPPWDNKATATLLSALPKLHTLSCRADIPGLEIVAECKTLRELTLHIYSDQDFAGSITKFLRQANQLRKIHLDYIDVEFNLNFVTMLIEALTSSRRSHLERLSLDGFYNVRPLLRALPQLPALRYLDVSSADPDDELLLQSITPASAPALRTLALSDRYKSSSNCKHSWLHWEALKATLRANPSLHIRVNGFHNVCNRQHCDACALECHEELRKSQGMIIGIFSHSLDKCSAPEDHSSDRPWIPI